MRAVEGVVWRGRTGVGGVRLLSDPRRANRNGLPGSGRVGWCRRRMSDGWRSSELPGMMQGPRGSPADEDSNERRVGEGVLQARSGGEGRTRWKRAEPVGARGDACGEGLEFLGIRAMSAATQHARERYNYCQTIVRLRSGPTRRTQRPRTVVTDFFQALQRQVALAGQCRDGH
jgi:hypothetical protein